MRALRTHQGGYFAALVALMLQIFLVAANSAPMPQVRGASSLLADLATICTIDGVKKQGGDSAPATSACDHCTLCHILKFEPLASPQGLATLPLMVQSVIYGLSPAVLVVADFLKNPTTRGPPAHL